LQSKLSKETKNILAHKPTLLNSYMILK